MPLGNLPQLLHVGAVTLSHNRFYYGVRGRLSFDFRDENGLLVSFRLQALQLPQSPHAGSMSIDVWLGGRWRSAASKLTKNQIVQVDCAVVARATDVLVNSLRLELHDPMPNLPFANQAAVHVMDEHLVLRHSISWSQLSQGLQSTAMTAGIPEGGFSWTSPQRKRPAKVSVGESARDYVYTSVADVWEKALGVTSKKEKVNVYGVVVDCRAPCVTRGPDMRCEVVIADETSMRGGELKTLAIYCFEKNPADCIPFRGVGDVIRAHRIHVGRYVDHVTGTETAQGVGRFYSTFLLWSFEGGDFLPIASRDPIAVGRQEGRGNVTHIVTSQDRERVSALRSWARFTFFRLHKIHRPYLRTVLEVNAAHETADFLASSRSFDLICRMENFYEEQGGKLRFIVSDGLLEGNEKQTLLVESADLDEHLQRATHSTFLDFCPNWEKKPQVLPVWLLIRDVRVEVGVRRIARLSVGKKTSTLVWHQENSPEVRYVKQKFNESRAGQSTHSIIPPISRPRQNGPGFPPVNNVVAQKENRDLGQTGHMAPQAQEQPTVSPRGVERVGNLLAVKRPPPNVSASPDVAAVPQPAQKVARMESGNDQRTAEQRTEERQTTIRVVDEANLPTFHPIQETLAITTHPNKQFPVSTIADMQNDVKAGNTKPHRLRVNARACIAPRDIRFACRPWCEKCSRLLKIDRNHGALECFSCSAKFTGTGDPNTKWSYLVRLNFEDSSGSRVECWIEGKEGSQFFAGLPAANLLSNTVARQKVNQCMQMILDPRHLFDCCVKPYEYQDKLGVYKLACKLFATSLLPEFVPKE